jgi:hypothetical protein
VVRAAILEALVASGDTAEEITLLGNQVTFLESQKNTVTTEKMVADAKARILSLRSGRSFSDWKELLGDSRILAQILHRDSSSQHQAFEFTKSGYRPAWNQVRFEANQNRVRRDTDLLLAREFLGGGGDRPPLERSGLAEVSYPGLRDLEAPAEFLGILDREPRYALEGCWTDYLSALCDTLRREGVLTLGSSEKDHDFLGGEGHIGKWSAANATRPGTLVRFVHGSRGKRNRFTVDVLAAAGCAEANRAFCAVR